MEKIKFMAEGMEEAADFFVLEQTKINGVQYILVTDSEEEDAEALILKDLSAEDEEVALYEIVQDDVELEGVLKIFEEILEDIEIQI